MNLKKKNSISQQNNADTEPVKMERKDVEGNTMYVNQYDYYNSLPSATRREDSSEAVEVNIASSEELD